MIRSLCLSVIMSLSLLSPVMILAESENATPQTAVDDTEIELRAREVGRALRCVICQNQSIEESDASLAADMRTLVRARLRQGDSNEDVIAFMQNRYGDYVLLKPPVQANTWLLWGLPFALVLCGGIFYVRRSRAQTSTQDAPASLDEDDIERLARYFKNR